jgi:hypothetical protein
MLIFIHLGVLHLELRHVIPRLVLIRLEVKLHYGAVPDGQRLPLLHLLKSLCLYWVDGCLGRNCLGLLQLILRFLWFLCQDIASSKV